MKLLLYDIFSDDIENHAIWLDSIEGLSAACDLMKRHAKENPGPHFILCKKTNTVLASINTLLSPDVQNPSLASSMAGDIFSVSMHGGRIVDAVIKAVLEHKDGLRFQVAFGQDQTALIGEWQVVKK
jgi:hypothetical protein